MTSIRTALVTGGNRGLGRETCRQLAASGWTVLLAARSASDAREAADEVGAVPVVLDVTDAAAVRELPERIAEHGPLGALVNNAGVSLSGFDEDVVRRTLAVNVTGAERVTDALAESLAPGASVVMVSSGMGSVDCLSSELAERFMTAETRADVHALLEEFRRSVAAGDHAQRGWPSSAYRVSKAGLNALTRVLSHELGGRGSRVNAVCPGWVRTSMGGAGATRDVVQGADTIVWAASTGPEELGSGGFFRDRAPAAW